MSNVIYYEINNQFLEISYPEIDSEFLYGFEYGNPETRNNGNGEIYLTKCFQISKNCIEKFGLEVKDGNTFSDDDMKYVSGKYIPVIVGSDYADTLKVGDLLKGVYIQDEFTYEVIGVLSKGANINLGGHEVSLDRYLVMPSLLDRCCSLEMGVADLTLTPFMFLAAQMILTQTLKLISTQKTHRERLMK